MYLRTLLLLIVLGAIAVFAAVNWGPLRRRRPCRSCSAPFRHRWD
jgi:hypothetical protein